MSLRTVACAFCQGSGKAEKWDTALMEPPVEVGRGVVVERIHARDCTPEVQASITRGEYVGVRAEWHTSECPRCSGKGEYEVEFTPVRIF